MLLPPPQRQALEVALLLVEAEGRTPEPRAVAVAFLGALRALARASPILVAVDDLQWLDAPSESVLRFAARRLTDEGVGLLITQRAVDARPVPLDLDRALPRDRFASIRVGPLALGALHRLVHERLGIALPRPLLLRLVEASGGNPFFALEIARAFQRGELQVLPGEPLPVPRRLDQFVRERMAALPEDTRDVLAAAAALSEPRLSVLQRALGADAVANVEPAIVAEVVSVDGDTIRFSHPLFASAVYAAVDPFRRRALHRGLAEVVDDLEERARHLAAGAEANDPAVAEVLDQAAQRARARGAPAAAAELAEKALHLRRQKARRGCVERWTPRHTTSRRAILRTRGSCWRTLSRRQRLEKSAPRCERASRAFTPSRPTSSSRRSVPGSAVRGDRDPDAASKPRPGSQSR